MQTTNVRKRNTHKLSTAHAVLAFLVIAFSAAAAEDYRAWVYTQLPDSPEGLAVDSHGRMYASLAYTGQVVRLEDDGTFTHIAWVPSKKLSGKGGQLLGLVTDKNDDIYVAYKGASQWDRLDDPRHPACHDVRDTTGGVYKIDVESGEVSAVATRGDGWPFCFPDDVDIDDNGNVYLTDLTYAGIWKVGSNGQVSLWSDHALLNWSSRPYSGFPLGVNVLVLDQAQKNIYAATDGDPMVLRIPIMEDGSAGEPVIVSRGHGPFDGIELDEEGNIYLSEILRSEIMVISPDGSQRLIIANKNSAPLDNNTSLVMRDGVLYTANLGFEHETPDEADRTVVAIEGFDRPKSEN